MEILGIPAGSFRFKLPVDRPNIELLFKPKRNIEVRLTCTLYTHGTRIAGNTLDRAYWELCTVEFMVVQSVRYSLQRVSRVGTAELVQSVEYYSLQCSRVCRIYFVAYSFVE
jgi:hypothetical protein